MNEIHDTDGTPSVPAKIAVLLRDDLAPWQRLNVTAFLVSGIAATRTDLIGKHYADKDGVRYLPMFGHPVMVYAGSAEVVGTAHRRALDRHLLMSVFTMDLFATNNDVDNRAAVAAVGTLALDLAGIALAAPRNAVDKVLKGARLHP